MTLVIEDHVDLGITIKICKVDQWHPWRCTLRCREVTPDKFLLRLDEAVLAFSINQLLSVDLIVQLICLFAYPCKKDIGHAIVIQVYEAVRVRTRDPVFIIEVQAVAVLGIGDEEIFEVLEFKPGAVTALAQRDFDLTVSVLPFQVNEVMPKK